MNHVFGPVPSRRLGRSLGVDLVPYKTCTYDCIYCQIGRTTHCTVERREWVPLEEVVGELAEKLATAPDVITLSGSGEPTLYARIGELIARIRTMTDIPVAVITNGSLLWMPEVRTDLLGAHIVVPSLDAGDDAAWRRVNRPVEGISFERMLGGLIDFRREFKGQYWLEVLLVAWVTDNEDAVRKLAECAKRIAPDRVQLNTVTRPPADADAAPVPRERLEEFARMFDPPAEVIAGFEKTRETAAAAAGQGDVLEMIRRRPCTVRDVADGLGLHPTEAAKHLAALHAEGLIAEHRVGERLYWRAN